jgi:hypothetical protein
MVLFEVGDEKGKLAFPKGNYCVRWIVHPEFTELERGAPRS